MIITTSSGRNRYPFTASQWQELEHQALIFKYMVSGIPIPPDLLFPIRRSSSCTTLDSSPLSNSKLFSRQSPHFGWSCFQMGLGLGLRKIDPEPGRCRRTDGKKWRCSKEAYADSKYCERHMHRGKNRSRKPVEVAAPTTHEPTAAPTIVSSITRNSLPLMSPQSQTHHQDHRIPYPVYQHHDHPNHQFFSPHSSSSRPLPTAPGIGLSSQENSTHHLLLNPAASFSFTNATDHRRNRNIDVYGLKEGVDEHAFFSEPSGSMRSLSAGSSLDDAWQLTPLTMSSSSSTTDSSKQRSNLSSLHNEYSYLQLQSLSDDHDNPKRQQQKQFHEQSYLLGTDLSSLAPIKLEREQQTQKTTVHRFFDEWPPKNKDSWLDLDDKSSDSASVSTTTRLSISIPSSHEFPIFNSRNNNDG